jgi:hypothetical protein
MGGDDELSLRSRPSAPTSAPQLSQFADPPAQAEMCASRELEMSDDLLMSIEYC